MTNIRYSTYQKDLIPRHKLLAELIVFSTEIRNHLSHLECSNLDDIGLLFWDQLGYYPCTPTNSIPFATTGGDGVHFGLVPISYLDASKWPVVMTVPMAGHENSANLIVGRDLHDFLCLGCHYGFFALESIAYPYCAQEALSELAMSDDELDHWEQKLELLRELRKRFKLSRWESIEKKLNQLQTEFRPHLIIDETTI